MLQLDGFEADSVRHYGHTAPAPVERTFFMIKPHAVSDGAVPDILAAVKQAGLTVVQHRNRQLSAENAKELYAAHVAKPWFPGFLEIMTRNPVVVCVLEGENAVQSTRDLMGATNPEKAAPGTLRARFGKNLDFNAVHGSDSLESARREIGLFFPGLEHPGTRPQQLMP